MSDISFGMSGMSSLTPRNTSLSPSLAELSAASAVAKRADDAIDKILKSADMEQALAARSSYYLPPSNGQVMSILWATVNTESASSVSKADIEKAIYAYGGNSADADALWSRMAPEGQSRLDASLFAYNYYLNQAVAGSLDSIQKTVKDYHLQNPTPTATMLGTFQAAGGSGDIISYLGTGGGGILA